MSEQNIHFRHLILFYFRKQKNAEDKKKMFLVRIVIRLSINGPFQNWIARFKDVDFNLDVRKRSGRTSTINMDEITNLIQQNTNTSVLRADGVRKWFFSRWYITFQ
ncbi:hypothetical protein WH47_02784 [Habropoda laboriosa]|uniref:Mos1 transposase HTH domain-containing protein n=1 Tax=Habropoda laboriosa TaxID=597456 RepID=A0A0L7QYU9_9HYME|nr:hypothetical protein WH47_02784 [Habropoda laboriosa]